MSPYENQPRCCRLRGSGQELCVLGFGVVALGKCTLDTFVVTETLPAWAQCPASRRMEICIMVWRFGDHLRLVWGLLISLEVSVLAFCALPNIPLGSPALDPAEHPEELSV